MLTWSLVKPYNPYKMKFWWGYYLAKHKRKDFGGINIGDLDTIISYYVLKLQLAVSLMCVCCPSGIVDMEAKAALWTIFIHQPFIFAE